MKGLLLKDLYMIKKYCRAALVVAIVFIAISIFENSNLTLIFFPSIICGMIPMHILAYDEQSRWLQYSETMPYTKSQIVSGKYFIGLAMQIVMMILTGIAQAIRMSINHTFQLNEYLVLMMLLLISTFTTPSICFPFMFKLGVQKGRIAYFVMLGIVSAGSIISSRLFLKETQKEIRLNDILPLLCLIVIGLYVLSWYLSIVFYKKREL